MDAGGTALADDPVLAQLPRDEQGRPLAGAIPLLRRIGRGGMGAVYYAVHPRLGAPVAVKVLPPDLVDREPSLAERFQAEARLAASLAHEHVVRGIEAGSVRPTFFMVMEFVEGESAKQYVRRAQAQGRPALEEHKALALVAAATKGLAAAHAAGIVHRDVKPDNILIPFRPGTKSLVLPRAKLADLGLAKPVGSLQTLGTLSYVAMGTPGYMAPEQAEDAKHAGPASDIFAMGATLYMLLTGEAPFRGSSLAAVLRATAESDPPPLPETVSGETVALVRRCLAREPERRFAGGAELAEAIEAVRSGRVPKDLSETDLLPTLPTAAPPAEELVSPVPPARRAPRDRGTLALAGPVVILAAALVVFVAVMRAMSPSPSPAPAPARAVDRADRAGRAALLLAEAEEREREGKLDEALSLVAEGRALDPAHGGLEAARRRILDRLGASRTAAERSDAFRAYMTAVDAATMAARARDTVEAWDAVLAACSKAEGNAQTAAERAGAQEAAAVAAAGRLMAQARQAQSRGEEEEALRLAKAAASSARAPKEAAALVAALEQARRAREERAARKRQYDDWAARAAAERQPDVAVALWRRALDVADDAGDAEKAHEAIRTLSPAQGAAMAEEAYRKAMGQAEAAERALRWSDAERLFRDALAAKPGDAAAKEGIGRAATGKERADYEAEMEAARTAEAAGRWSDAARAYKRALAVRPTDPPAGAGLRRAEVRLGLRMEVALGGPHNAAMEFVRLETGFFTMGDRKGDADERPREMRVKGFWIQTTEVTQAQWEAVMGTNPSRTKRADLPVVGVAAEDCRQFLARLSQIKKLSFRLPTEAEWEYACRAGSTERWSFGGDEKQLPAHAVEKGGLQAVASRKANAWSLFDMHGNAWEWCAGVAPTAGRDAPFILRGGCADGKVQETRASNRATAADPQMTGFRAALSE
jgi:formylglycine-generating enzyme required for sulfatase activity